MRILAFGHRRNRKHGGGVHRGLAGLVEVLHHLDQLDEPGRYSQTDHEEWEGVGGVDPSGVDEPDGDGRDGGEDDRRLEEGAEERHALAGFRGPGEGKVRKMLARFRETGVRRVCALKVLDFLDALHHFDSCRRKAPLSLGEAFRQALEPAERQAHDEDHDERPDGEQNRAHAPIDPHEIGEAGEEGYGGVGRVAGEMGDEGVDRARVVGDYLPDLSRGRLIDGPQRNAA